MKKVVITGVAGFLGSHIADSFLSLGWDVIGIDNLVGGYESNIPVGVDFIKADLLDSLSYGNHLDKAEMVIHAACTAYEGLSVFSPAYIVQNTTQITVNLLSLSAKYGIKKFVYLSSMARYGTQKNPFTEDMEPKPQDPYGIAKYASELLVKNICQTHGMKHVILVPHNIIGPRQKYDDPFRNVASIMINRILWDKNLVIYGSGNQERCFSDISDVIRPIMAACFEDSLDGEIINIGPDEEVVSINQLGILISEKIFGRAFQPIYYDKRPNEVESATCSANKARKLLGYNTQVTLEESLNKLASWIQTQEKRDFSYHIPIEIQTAMTPKTWTDKLI